MSLFSMAMPAGSCWAQMQKKKAERPNILLFITDDQSFAHTGFSGCEFIRTPGFDKVASNGIFFENCISGSPGSAPARSSLVTGRYPWQNEQSGQHYSSWMKKYVPVVDILEAGGYCTGYTGKGVEPFKYAGNNPSDSLFRKGNAAGIAFNGIKYDKEAAEIPAKGIVPVNYFENFRHFVENRKDGEPFYFWCGTWEPHRPYEKDSWIKNHRTTRSAVVPGFMPDAEEIKGDLLDYAIEIEWADSHLLKMINYLDSIGELDNTVIIATADNGMAFPAAKALCTEYGIHVPLAIWYPDGFPGKRKIEDVVSFTDIVPTLLELTGISPEGMLPVSGKSILPVLQSRKEGVVDPERTVLSGRERHTSARWNNVGYPQRAIRSLEYLLIWNMKPERWPAGAPHALNKAGKEVPALVYAEIGASPSKSFLLKNHDNPQVAPYFELACSKRPEYELYHITEDPYCKENLAGKQEYAGIEGKLKEILHRRLRETKDPRVVGPDKEIFDTYKRYSGVRSFPKPEWAK